MISSERLGGYRHVGVIIVALFLEGHKWLKMDDRKTVTSKEIQAMIFNLKEQRILQKTMQTLDLEENYSMKLIGLGNRQVKIGHKRMKNKVRIR